MIGSNRPGKASFLAVAHLGTAAKCSAGPEGRSLPKKFHRHRQAASTSTVTIAHGKSRSSTQATHFKTPLHNHNGRVCITPHATAGTAAKSEKGNIGLKRIFLQSYQGRGDPAPAKAAKAPGQGVHERMLHIFPNQHPGLQLRSHVANLSAWKTTALTSTPHSCSVTSSITASPPASTISPPSPFPPAKPAVSPAAFRSKCSPSSA